MKNTTVSKAKSFLYALIVSLALIAIDQWTKWLAATHLKNQAPLVLWKGVFKLEYLENRGAAFGIMQNRQFLFSIGAVFIVLIVCFLYQKLPQTPRFRILRICSVLICAGAIGNLIDRVVQNFVVDFFYFELINFPIFNVADCYVVVACILFAISILFYYKEEELSFFERKKG